MPQTIENRAPRDIGDGVKDIRRYLFRNHSVTYFTHRLPLECVTVWLLILS